LLPFHGDTQQFYIVDSDICISKIQREIIVAFVWQQFLGEDATILGYTYIAYVVTFCIHNTTMIIFLS
jgi:hypothetical protein